MNVTTLQNKIYAGYAKAALRVGQSNAHYRPLSALNPISSGNKLANLYVSYNAQDMGYQKPSKYGNNVWYALLDGTQTLVGDYLVDPVNGDYFIAAMQQNLPILVVSCNAVINITRQHQQSSVGAVGYGGSTLATESMLMQQWPCSLLIGAGIAKTDGDLPGDTKAMGVQILLPFFTGVILAMGDIVTDQIGRRFAITSAELSDLGWRLNATQATT